MDGFFLNLLLKWGGSVYQPKFCGRWGRFWDRFCREIANWDKGGKSDRSPDIKRKLSFTNFSKYVINN